MKKLFYIFVLVLLTILFIPNLSSAAEYRTDGNLIIGQDEIVNDDLYIAGGQVDVEGTIKGDLFVWGGQIDIKGMIEGDLNLMGGNTRLEGDIDGDLRVGSGTLELKGRVGGDLLAAGGSISLAKEAQVEGESYVAGGSLLVDGTLNQVKAAVGSLILRSNSKIDGDLVYYSKNEAQIEEGADIKGETKFKKTTSTSDDDYSSQASSQAISLLTTIVLALVVIYYLPNLALSLADRWRGRPVKFGLYGLLALIFIPFAAIVLMLTIVGLPLGVGLALVYPIALYLAKLGAVIALGYCIQKYFAKEKVKMNWLTVLIGSLVYYLVGLIPLIGGLVAFVLTVIAFGALAGFVYRLWVKLKHKKAI